LSWTSSANELPPELLPLGHVFRHHRFRNFNIDHVLLIVRCSIFPLLYQYAWICWREKPSLHLLWKHHQTCLISFFFNLSMTSNRVISWTYVHKISCCTTIVIFSWAPSIIVTLTSSVHLKEEISLVFL
jgi:hypothetical protein